MRKVTFVSLISFLFLSLCSLFEHLFRNISFSNAWIPLAIGVAILIVSGILFNSVKSKLAGNISCFITNSLAFGLCIRSWYIYRNFENELWVMLLVSLVCVAYLILFYLLLYIPPIERRFNIFIWVYIILTIVIYLLVMDNTKTTYVSTFGYFVIIEISFIFAMCKNKIQCKSYLKI